MALYPTINIRIINSGWTEGTYLAVIGIEPLMHKGESLRYECIDAPEQTVLWDAVVDDPQMQMIAEAAPNLSSELAEAELRVISKMTAWTSV